MFVQHFFLCVTFVNGNFTQFCLIRWHDEYYIRLPAVKKFVFHCCRSSVGPDFARKRATIFLILTVVFIAIGVGVTVTEINLSSVMNISILFYFILFYFTFSGALII